MTRRKILTCIIENYCLYEVFNEEETRLSLRDSITKDCLTLLSMCNMDNRNKNRPEDNFPKRNPTMFKNLKILHQTKMYIELQTPQNIV
ncbi:hypothetical protein HZS_5282 [Henneguya salminicola]|nr:hypothetical protein HZS_5282 [Henneguya salminicola]